ncbi:MAG: hypothetical protein ACHQ9S_25935 [Candidatus Binatia bacterium]
MKRTARIPISSTAEFEKLLDSVANDAVSASIHWKLLSDLSTAATSFEREMNQSLAFWSLTFAAHREAVLFRLARLYDQGERALSLRTWLGTIEANMDLFDQEGFRERLKDNPFVDSLARSARRPDATILTADIDSVSRKSDALVTKICNLRHKVLAHRDPSLVLRTGPSNAAGITNGDTEQLLDRAVTLVNRYSSIFRARTYSTTIVGADDYESMLRFVQRGINACEAEIDAESGGA